MRQRRQRRRGGGCCLCARLRTKSPLQRTSRLLGDKCTFRNIKVTRGTANDDLEVHFLSLQLAGMDLRQVFRPRYLPRRTIPAKKQSTASASKPATSKHKAPMTIEADDDTLEDEGGAHAAANTRACSHKCDKNKCNHGELITSFNATSLLFDSVLQAWAQFTLTCTAQGR
eukprot:m.87385 g.87385  ORF g.87385 m.87385 type:complete len:171 (-) comp13582_c0_seq17:1047-1559(-)